ncbi:hypothetical protein [Methylobacterium nigriterrae]|uniref:hypothetical protein n=1 Tax=Methylobacterium nigriterrae TaxID=3127512 RepID=UPI00301327A2
MPRWLAVSLYALILFPPAGMLLLILWPLVRLSGSVFTLELEVILLGGLTAGLSFVLALIAASQAVNSRLPRNRRA